ncbi:hypothetical protein PFICI_03750 [Pestalotiopsis fici W106-1]|uniref:Uncharacterized protein n=1 Tax=Pestalotiopsis fici (strain W106-1 / CGMCC3.15140) TaxID=1229662 RepID=W3XI91_PESFW|nr:uncharacterized protein PFICI_03750 [Pestalotiopsis fici W106-1]ETS85725.1 hypothetical protein PFICI_03750 [Pestalotiopsis fici W106-1]
MSTGLMPVDEVSGFYDTSRHQLSLSAKGSVQPKTNDICFKRSKASSSFSSSSSGTNEPVFELVGTTYAIMGSKRPYNVQQREDGVALRQGQDVFVKTANNPAGEAIKVFWGGGGLANTADSGEV